MAVASATLGVIGTAWLSTPAWSQGGPSGGGPTVEAVELDCENPCVDSFEIIDGEVKTEDLANGSVTPEKLSFDPVPLQRVVYVNGDDSAETNGSALLEAFNDIVLGTGPCSSPGPSADAPCLVKLGPGVFDVSGSLVETIEHVDIEGSGQKATTILSTSGIATIRISDDGDNLEIRHLSVEYDDALDAGNARAIADLGSPQNVRLSHLNVTAASGTVSTSATALALGGGSSYRLTDVLAEASGPAGSDSAIEVGGSAAVEMHNVRALGDNNGMVVVNTAAVIAHASVFEGTLWSVSVGNGFQAATADIHGGRLIGNIRVQTSSLLGIAASQVDANNVTEDGTLDCVFAYDENFAALDADCGP